MLLHMVESCRWWWVVAREGGIGNEVEEIYEAIMKDVELIKKQKLLLWMETEKETDGDIISYQVGV